MEAMEHFAKSVSDVQRAVIAITGGACELESDGGDVPMRRGDVHVPRRVAKHVDSIVVVARNADTAISTLHGIIASRVTVRGGGGGAVVIDARVI